MTKDWKKALINAKSSIRESLLVIDSAALKIGLVVDDNQILIGTLSDGDVRRGILRGISLDENVQTIINTHPTTVNADESRQAVLDLMKEREIYQIPLVDSSGKLVGLEVLDSYLGKPVHDNWVVLMAGGMGTRLRPITEKCPKPMLEVGGRPILETILNSFIDYGFHQFYIAINYLGEMIEDYFGDGSNWGVNIRYLREDKRLGTAGALSLIEERPQSPIMVMNADVLTKIDFQHLLDFHIQNRAQATMCVREYDFQVPYGVAVVDHHRLVSIEEKPVHSFFVNAGIYTLEPQVLDLIPKDTFCDMPTVLEQLLDMKKETAVFPIREYWLDLGRHDDFLRAQGEYEQVFE